MEKTKYSISDASVYLKEKYNITKSPESLRAGLIKYDLLPKNAEGHWGYTIEKKVLDEYIQTITSPLVISNISEYSYSQIYYACLKLGIKPNKKYGYKMFKNERQKEAVLDHIRESKKSIGK